MFKSCRPLIVAQSLRNGCRAYSVPTHTSMSDAPVRVRFAPSPTGHLHLGGLRTALYNYLFSRSHNGTFILRIEDTDQARLVPGAVNAIIDMLEWTGIRIDEGPLHGGLCGPYVQSERLSIYNEHIQALLQNGSAYHCFCTSKRLELLRKEAVSRGEVPKYDNRCRYLSAADVKARLANNEQYVVRFKLSEYNHPWDDLVYGPITYNVAAIEGDPILMKSDGYPTYHFANVVDDHLMQVTHVLRGVEWQVSTTKHILLYNAFGWNHPVFAHLPLLMNKDGKKLSKRQNDIHIGLYKEKGYLPEAVLNLLTNVGSGFKVKETAGMTLDELVAQFDVTRVSTNSTRIDFDRLLDFNRLHLQRLLAEHGSQRLLIDAVRCLLKTYAAENKLETATLSDELILRLLHVNKGRIRLLSDLLRVDYQFAWVKSTHDDVVEKLSPKHVDVVSCTVNGLSSLGANQFTAADLQTVFDTVMKTTGLPYGQYMKLLRSSVGGPMAGPTVVDILAMLGKEETLRRLQRLVTTRSVCHTQSVSS